jgi:hypothetical protein
MKQFTKVGLEYGMLKNVPIDDLNGILNVSINRHKLFEHLNKIYPKTWMKVYDDDGCTECVTSPTRRTRRARRARASARSTRPRRSACAGAT